MSTNCKFIFERGTPNYYSGEEIVGSITLSTTKRLSLEVITLTFTGTGKVQWSEMPKALQIVHDDSTHILQKACYYGRDVYVKDCIVLGENVGLSAGEEFKYDFRFTIPSNAPATCQKNYGEVTYGLHLILQHTHGCKCNKTFHQVIIINNRRDLNKIPKCNEPYSVKGSLAENLMDKVKFSVPYTGYMPGQLIEYNIDYGNITHAHKVLLNLWQKFCYRSQLPIVKVKEVRRVIALLRSCVQNPSTHGRIMEGGLRIPLAIPLSSEHEVKAILIHVSYYLEAVFVSKMGTVLLKFQIPITIGSSCARPSLGCTEVNDYCYDNLGMPKDIHEEFPLLNVSAKSKLKKDTNCTKCSINVPDGEKQHLGVYYSADLSSNFSK